MSCVLHAKTKMYASFLSQKIPQLLRTDRKVYYSKPEHGKHPHVGFIWWWEGLPLLLKVFTLRIYLHLSSLSVGDRE